jgi:hypothetical protein
MFETASWYCEDGDSFSETMVSIVLASFHSTETKNRIVKGTGSSKLIHRNRRCVIEPVCLSMESELGKIKLCILLHPLLQGET